MELYSPSTCLLTLELLVFVPRRSNSKFVLIELHRHQPSHVGILSQSTAFQPCLPVEERSFWDSPQEKGYVRRNNISDVIGEIGVAIEVCIYPSPSRQFDSRFPAWHPTRFPLVLPQCAQLTARLVHIFAQFFICAIEGVTVHLRHTLLSLPLHIFHFAFDLAPD